MFELLGIVEILHVVDGIVPEFLRGRQLIGCDELPNLGAQFVEDVAQATFALAAEDCSLLLVHLEVAGEGRLPREDPTPAQIPPAPYRSGREAEAEAAEDGGHGLGPPEGPFGRGRGYGLDLDREGGDPLPKAYEVGVLLGALRNWEVVFEWHARKEPSLLDALQEGGHANLMKQHKEI